jgi:ubiquinone/menaquinone biosynthesis C-methylase UbiE
MLRVINEIVTLFGFPFRKKRHEFFEKLFLKGRRKVRILDVGGTEEYWRNLGFDATDYPVTILNLVKVRVRRLNFKSIVGDALNMKNFGSREFDVVFSNSVIEHVGDWQNKKKMADEIQRVGKHYFVQTPNYFFPIEPHLLFPFFQFFPSGWQKLIYKNLYSKTSLRSQAFKPVDSIRLLKKEELLRLFRGGKLKEEKFLGLTKSFIIYK